MKSKCVCLLMLAFLSLALGRAGFAQEVQPLEPEWLRQMYADGWQKVQEGVLQRDTGRGSFETFGYGAEGLQWLVQSYEQQVQFFEDKYNESPSTEILELIEQLRSKVDSLNVELQAAPSAEPFNGEVLEGCSFSYDATTYAGPQESPQGVTATARAYLHNDCGYVGNTTAYAYAQAIDGTLETYLTKMDPKNNGTWLDSYASASANGSTACESRAQATVEIPQLGIYYAASPAENYSCPDNVSPVVASVSGPTSVTTDYYTSAGCADVTWTASATGGHSGGYTYSWYIGTDPTIQGTASTFTKTYCNTSQSVTVKVVVSDSSGNTDDSLPFTTTISNQGAIAAGITGPTSVSSSTSCTTVTWTASATSTGHSGFTYEWYIGTTLQTTGTTFSKQFCSSGGASQSVTVKVTATASDGHQDTYPHTTSITFPPSPLAASISGQTNAFLLGDCKALTWTANATGGAPSYTYSWYIGTSTTVQGTSSTLTKTFCGEQTINVKVTVRDAAAQTANASFTTTLHYKEVICKTCTQ